MKDHITKSEVNSLCHTLIKDFIIFAQLKIFFSYFFKDLFVYYLKNQLTSQGPKPHKNLMKTYFTKSKVIGSCHSKVSNFLLSPYSKRVKRKSCDDWDFAVKYILQSALTNDKGFLGKNFFGF